MQIVFQDPFGSLNPRLTVERVIEEPLLNHEALSGAERRERVEEALVLVGLLAGAHDALPARVLRRAAPAHLRRPALVLRPRLVIGDEPVSALDVSVRAQV